MEEFEKVYAGLNAAQKEAVDAIDGPVLVVAGPGTGKTQLLGARVAQILRTTDTLPQNILCLTFTESGAQNMRDRLTRFIGAEAYNVQISTYHAFGGDLIRRYPEYFTQMRLERPVDELGKRQILSALVDNLDYRNPLKQTRHHMGDLMSTISEVKRGLLTPQALRQIAAINLSTITQASRAIGKTLEQHTKRLPVKLDKAEPLFQNILQSLKYCLEKFEPHPPFENLAALSAHELESSLAKAAEAGKTTPLTAWKNTWLSKDSNDNYVLSGTLEAERMRALADVLEAYESALAERGLYDFDDMILRAIQTLEANSELKYTLQERYQYLLLDEFQDTNAAQLQLVKLLTDNPAHEGRPNVLAVGDDDQAIYAFQGAQYSNMLDYFHLYRSVTVINLTENYRSSAPILQTAQNISKQIGERLSSQFKDLEKTLFAANKRLPRTDLQRIEYFSDIAELQGVADTIAGLIKKGVQAAEIAVFAPKHRYLEPLVPYLQASGVPVRYERRENILEAPVVRQLITMSKLVLALHDRQNALADSYWPEVLSYDFWQFPVSGIWQVSWVAGAQRKHWSELLLVSPEFRPAALLFLSLATQVETETYETILDRLIGTEEVVTNEADIPQVRSRLRTELVGDGTPDSLLYHAITELTILRARLREHQLQQGRMLNLRDFLHFIAEYEAADEQMVNTSPYSEAAEAVQLMTVFKAKGLEFAHVFLLNCQDDVWGSSARGTNNKLTLPANLAPIRHAGTTEDERLRIFYVAITRAKYGLHLTSHRQTYTGKTTPRLKYLNEVEQDDGSVVSLTLADGTRVVERGDTTSPPLEALELHWQSRHTDLGRPKLRELLRERLSRYQLSPTHLTTFIDLEHAGPVSFLLHTLLKFPTAPGVDLAFGNAMHETLEWLQIQVNEHGALPAPQQAATYMGRRLELQPLTPEQLAVQQGRARVALEAFLSDNGTLFKPGNRPEHNFRDEGVLLPGGVHLGGKVDLLEIDQASKTITIVDYKTGNPRIDPAKRHRYELQLYCYKILLEGSHSYKGYQVGQGSLVFVEPDTAGNIQRHAISFNAAEQERVQQLLAAMWQRVCNLDLPDIAAYGTSLTAIKQFEQDLIGKRI